MGETADNPAHRRAVQAGRLFPHADGAARRWCSARSASSSDLTPIMPSACSVTDTRRTMCASSTRKRRDFPIAAQAATQAYTMAGVGPGGLHGAELHDCFSVSEILQYELLGFAPPGRGAELLESGATALPSVRDSVQIKNAKTKFQNLPVNAGGGLIGDGHPVGATGVRQVVEAYTQLTSRAGSRQITGARRFLTCNIGGTYTTTVVTIWESV